jgi:hypothetical protein
MMVYNAIPCGSRESRRKKRQRARARDVSCEADYWNSPGENDEKPSSDAVFIQSDLSNRGFLY